MVVCKVNHALPPSSQSCQPCNTFFQVLTGKNLNQTWLSYRLGTGMRICFFKWQKSTMWQFSSLFCANSKLQFIVWHSEMLCTCYCDPISMLYSHIMFTDMVCRIPNTLIKGFQLKATIWISWKCVSTACCHVLFSSHWRNSKSSLLQCDNIPSDRNKCPYDNAFVILSIAWAPVLQKPC